MTPFAEKLAAFRKVVRLHNERTVNNYPLICAIREAQVVFFGATLEQISDRRQMTRDIWAAWVRMSAAFKYWAERTKPCVECGQPNGDHQGDCLAIS